MADAPEGIVYRWTEERAVEREDPDGRWCIVASFGSAVTLRVLHLASNGEWLPHGPSIAIPNLAFRRLVDDWSRQ